MQAKITSLFAAVLVLASVSISNASMYICNSDAQEVSHLYTLTTAGVATEVGKVKLGGDTNLDIRDIAYNATTGTMYAITNSSLYTLDFRGYTGGVVGATLVGPSGASNLQGLAVAPNGTIYAGNKPSGTAGNLYTLNATNGAAISMGSFGVGDGEVGDYLRDYGDLAFSPAGTLYGIFVWKNHATNNYLGTVSTSNGAAAPLGGTAKSNADGLAFIGDTLYCVSANKLYTLDSSTGQVLSDTAIFANGVEVKYITGLTYVNQVPLPGSAWLLLSGLAGLGILRRRGKVHKV